MRGPESNAWKESQCLQVAGYLREGMSASQIGGRMGMSRHAIVSAVHRFPMLRAIGFARAKTEKMTNEERLLRRREQSRIYRERAAAAKSNVIKFPRVKRPAQVVEAAPAQPAPLRVVANNEALMIQDWLAKNGGARRFDEKESASELSIIDFLKERGFSVRKSRFSWNRSGEKWALSRGAGRPQSMSWSEIMGMVDEMRIAEGLQPFFGALQRNQMLGRFRRQDRSANKVGG